MNSKLYQIGARLAEYLGEKPKIMPSTIVKHALDIEDVAKAVIAWDEAPSELKDEMLEKIKEILPRKKGAFGREVIQE